MADVLAALHQRSVVHAAAQRTTICPIIFLDAAPALCTVSAHAHLYLFNAATCTVAAVHPFPLPAPLLLFVLPRRSLPIIFSSLYVLCRHTLLPVQPS